MRNNTAAQPDKNDVVILELDKPRELRLGHKALKRFSALTGCSMADMDTEIQHYDKMTALIYCMLATDAEKHGETLTPEQVDELLDPVPIKQLLACCMAAVKASFDPDGEADAENEEETEADPPQAAGTGVEA